MTYDTARYPLRFPRLTSRDLPITVDYQTRPHSDVVTLTLTTPSGWAVALVDVLGILTSIAHDLRRNAEGADRNLRVDEYLSRRRARYDQVLQAYQGHRRHGVLHRAAIRAIVADPQFADLQPTFSTINACVQNWLKDQRPIPRKGLRSVSAFGLAPKSERAQRTLLPRLVGARG